MAVISRGEITISNVNDGLSSLYTKLMHGVLTVLIDLQPRTRTRTYFQCLGLKLRLRGNL